MISELEAAGDACNHRVNSGLGGWESSEVITKVGSSPDESHLVASPGCHPSVETVVAHVGLSILEPLHADGTLPHVKVILIVIGTPLQHDARQKETGSQSFVCHSMTASTAICHVNRRTTLDMV